METCNSVRVRYGERQLINATARLLGVPEEKYLTYLSILAERETWDKYHLSARNQELGWEDFCEYSEKEMAVYHEVVKIVRENCLEMVIAKNLKVQECTFLNGTWEVTHEKEYCMLGFPKIIISSLSNSNTSLSQ